MWHDQILVFQIVNTYKDIICLSVKHYIVYLFGGWETTLCM